MSQVSSYAAANGAGSAVRAAFNLILAAVKGNNSGTSAPSGAEQGMSYENLRSATCQEKWVYDGTQWVLTQIVDPTAHKIYPANVRAISGLTLSNNGTDATNDIDIAAGWTGADEAGVPLILPAAITKRLDANWAVGTNQGGLDTGSIANTTYHVWLIRRPDTGVVDVLFSASASAPTMPTNYTQKRRIGSIIRSAGAIVFFTQAGDVFRRAAVTDRSSTSAAASALLTISVPTGIVVAPILRLELRSGAASSAANNALGSASEGSASVVVQAIETGAGDSVDHAADVISGGFFTNTSAQIYFAASISAGTISNNLLETIGWIDRRGQDAA